MTAKRKRLGELVIRSSNPQALVAFYRDVIGLELFASFGTANFLKVDDDLEGHPQILAIFDKTHTYSGPKDLQPAKADAGSGTLHHFAFVMEFQDFNAECDRLEKMDLNLKFAEHKQFGWRSIYLFDPDGNSVELVCYDENLLKQAAS